MAYGSFDDKKLPCSDITTVPASIYCLSIYIMQSYKYDVKSLYSIFDTIKIKLILALTH